MRRRLACLLAIFAIALGWSVAATKVVADGIPTPIPGVVDGPSGDSLRAIAQANGLTCQDDPAAPGTEATCSNGATPGGEQDGATFFTNPGLVMVATAAGNAPLPAHGRSFLLAMTTPFCAGGEGAVAAFYDQSIAAGPKDAGYAYEDATCRLFMRFNNTAEFAFRAITAFSLINAPAPIPTIVASPPAVPAPSAVSVGSLPAATAPPAVAGSGGSRPVHPGGFAAAVARPASVSTDLGVIAQSALLALIAVLLMPFPAQLFNSTLEKHYDEVRGWFPRVRLPISRFWRSGAGVAAFLGLSALLYALLDPDLGLNVESAAEIVGIGLGILLTSFAFEIPTLIAHRRLRDAWRLQVLPGTIVVGIACVVISRLTGFLPGYLYGLIVGLSFAREVSASEEGRNTALAGLVMLALAVASWVTLGVVGDATGIAAVAAQTILAAVVVGGLEGAVFGLVPLRFLKGEALWAWSRVAWGVVFGVAVFAFAHILLNPQSGYLADSSRTSLFTIVALLVGFGAVSVGFWAYFRFRPSRPEALPATAGSDEASTAG